MLHHKILTDVFGPKERRLRDIPANCSILKMEFLHPPQDDHEQIVLLLIISRNGKTRMLWYEWSCKMGLHRSQLKAFVQSLPRDERLPLLLIPLKHQAAFMVVYEKQITLYKDLLTGSPRRYIQRLEEVRGPEQVGISGRKPVWVQWARPMRKLTDEFTVDHDEISLCREDGVVQYLSLVNVEHTLDRKHKVSRLGINVNTAFAILDAGPNKGDVFAVGGDMSEGGLWRSEPRSDPVHLRTISNWTPLTDVSTVSTPAEQLREVGSVITAHKTSEGQPRMFACTGRSRHGAVTELRYGYDAPKTLPTHDLSDEVNRDVLNVWAFHGSFGHAEQQYEYKESLKSRTYLLISCPMRTFLLRVPLEGRALVVNLDLGLKYNSKTIAATYIERGLIQVTEDSIRITSLKILQNYQEEGAGAEEQYDQHQEVEVKMEDQEDITAEHEQYSARPSFRYNFEGLKVLTACIYAVPETTLILLAGQQAESFHLQLGFLMAEYVPLETIPLQSQASSLLLRKFGDHVLALVGNVEGEIQIFLADISGSHLELVSKYKLQGSYAICDSLAVTTSSDNPEEQPNFVVVCGLRNGLVNLLCLGASPSCEFLSQESFEIALLTASDSLTLLEELVIGNTSVTVLSDAKRKTRTIIHCEEILCALEYPKGIRGPLCISRILMTDRENPGFQNGPLSAFTQAVDSWLTGGVPGWTAGLFFCIDGDQLHTISLDPTLRPGLVPRRLPIGGTPVKVVYSTYLQKLIVLYNKTPFITRGSTPSRRDRGAPHKRALLPRIAFCDPDSRADRQLGPDAMDVEPDLQLNEDVHNDAVMDREHRPSERFIGITEWFPLIDGKQYHMLVIHTILPRAEKQIGRLLFFAISPGTADMPKLTIKKRIELGRPVYSVAVHPDEKSLIYCSGSELYIQSLDSAPSGIKWHSLVKAEMRSPARHITILGPLIYVSSTRESLIVYRYERGNLVYQYGDQCAREGLHHIHVPEHSLLLASDMNNTVVGLCQPAQRRIDNAMSAVFEAALPNSITRLTRVAKPAWSHGISTAANSEIIIGIGVDGTVTQLDIVTKGFRVFKFIQNLAERNPITCPFAGIMPHKRQLEPKADRPHRMHVNGDILKRVLERGGEECIRDMLNVKPDLEMYSDFDSVEDRWARFRELAGEVVDIGDEGWLGGLVKVMESRLRGAF